jgi:hypothetical protein
VPLHEIAPPYGSERVRTARVPLPEKAFPIWNSMEGLEVYQSKTPRLCVWAWGILLMYWGAI